MFVENVVPADRSQLVCYWHHCHLRPEAAVALDECWEWQPTVMGGRHFHMQFLGVCDYALVAVNVHMHSVDPDQQDCNMSLFLLWDPCPVVTVGFESIWLNPLLAGYQTPHNHLQQAFENCSYHLVHKKHEQSKFYGGNTHIFN